MKRLPVYLTIIMLVALVLSACAPAVQETVAPTKEVQKEAPTKEPAAEKVTLKMTAWDISATPYWQAVIDAYEAKNPNVKVELIDISSAEYQDKVNIMLSGGDESDIITVKDIPGYSAMLTRNQIIPLNDYVKKDALDLSVYSGAAEELTYEGSIYALPFRSDIWILYYNKDLFDAAGVAYPTNDMTWKEFDTIARQMTSGSGADKVYGAHFHTWRSTVELATVQALLAAL